MSLDGAAAFSGSILPIATPIRQTVMLRPRESEVFAQYHRASFWLT